MIRKIVFPGWMLSALFLYLHSIAVAQTPSSTQTQQPLPRNTLGIAANPPASGPDSDLSYRIGPGDELDIRVFGRRELSSVVRVDNYGKIRLPFLKEMQGACYTEAQLAAIIAEGYKKYLQDPQVDVLVKEFRSQPVAVIGAVSQPGRFQLQRRVRLLELITFAGGPHTRAGATVHIIHSSEHDHCSQTSVKDQPKDQPKDQSKDQPKDGEGDDSLSRALTSIKLRDLLAGSPEANPFVQSGDIISIPEADQIFVTGSVVKPGAYTMPTRITLTQAVALAGGINMEGSSGRVRLVRGEPGKGERKETVYNLNDIHKRKIQDVALMPNDIVEVPSSTIRMASRSILGVSINMLTSLPYFVLR
ncbi:MAG: polysaccharide biosynthesis/export family protein [Blastocatellales bacterium]